MKTKFFLAVIFIISIIMVNGQRPAMELTFTAIDSAEWVQLDSIKVMNCTQGGDTILYWPDTVLVLDYQVGIPEANSDVRNFQVFQNYPNPVAEQTTISFYVPEKDKVSLIVTDILGRVILKSDKVLDKGLHSFRFTPGSGNLYFFTASWQGQSNSIKILQSGFHSGGTTTLEYTGSEGLSSNLKKTEEIQSFLFDLGDDLLYICYNDTLQSGMLDTPEASATYTFQFATNIPCPGTPTVTYEGQVYNTIQIFSQCWLKENMNVGTMINGNEEMTDDGTIEKYCYDNNPSNCGTYGGLYQWNEMMQYTTTQGTQGICPPGWHIPSDEEWKLLEGAVDSQYDYPDPEWDIIGYRGFDAALNLKSTSGWISGGNGTDMFGFTARPGGWLPSYGDFSDLGYLCNFWSSTENYTNNVWRRGLSSVHDAVARGSDDGDTGFSSRCLKDD